MRHLLTYGVAIALSLAGAAGAQEIDLDLLAPEVPAAAAEVQAEVSSEDEAIIAPVDGELSEYLSDATGRQALRLWSFATVVFRYCQVRYVGLLNF